MLRVALACLLLPAAVCEAAPPKKGKGPQPEDVKEMEEWWCKQNPSSIACERLKIHDLPAKERKAAMKKLHEKAHSNDAAKDTDHQDIKKMHDEWCKIKPDHTTCDAWKNHRAKIHKDL